MSMNANYHAKNPKVTINFSCENQIHMTEKGNAAQGVTIYFKNRNQMEELFWKLGKALYEPATVEE